MKTTLSLWLVVLLCAVHCTGLVFLTPNPIYNLSDWRNKYSPVKVPSAALTVSDCTSAYRTRTFLEPLTLRFFCNRGSSADCHATTPTNDVPIVVISSNRSKWIARTLAESPVDSKLFYDPARVGNRPIFVFVNAIEFETYSDNLRNSSVRVIGCQGTSHSLAHSIPLNSPTKYFGFGFSRYCALVFFRKVKYYRKLWMVDDNLRDITHLPIPSPLPQATNRVSASSINSNRTFQLSDQLSIVEKTLETQRLAAIGFSTGSSNVHLEDFNSDPTSYQEHFLAPPCALEPLPDLGFLEQAYLFNRDEMDSFSFSPKFILSKEDMSFTRVLSRNRPVKRYSGSHLYKYRIEASQLDNPSGLSQWDFGPLNTALNTIHATWSSPSDIYRFEDGSIVDFVEQSAKLSFVPQLSGVKSPVLRTAPAHSHRGSEPWFKYGIKAVDAILRACSWREEPQFTSVIESEFKDSIPLERVSVFYV